MFPWQRRIGTTFSSRTQTKIATGSGSSRAIEKLNATLWFDEQQIAPGESVTKALESGLRSSDIIAIVFSEKTSQRPSVLFELGAAVGMGKRVVPIVSADQDLSELPVPVRARRFLRRGKPEETAAELLAEPATMS